MASVVCKALFINPEEYDKCLCTSCHSLLKQAVQVNCGHLFCEDCIPRNPSCPSCEEDVDVKEYYPDNFVRRKTDALEMVCPYHASGCEWSGSYGKFESHLVDCNYSNSVSPTRGVQRNGANDVVTLSESDVRVWQSLVELDEVSDIGDVGGRGAMMTASAAILHKEKTKEVWKIFRLNQRVVDARNGRSTSDLSSPFYTGRYGFKVRLQLDIFRDDIDEVTYISISLVLMEDEFDSSLQRPFTHKVTFKLINQKNDGRKDILYTFHPVPNYDASACNPRLIIPCTSLSSGYIEDDAIVIECSIDTQI